jgi:hypothetical protein
MPDGLASPTPPRFFAAAWIVGNARAQRLMWSQAGCLWTHRPLPSLGYAQALGAGRRFALHRGSWMSVLVPMVVFSQFVDVLLAQGAIHVVAVGAQRLQLHALLLFLSLWTVVWAVSLRSATRHVDHVLGEHALTLAIGFKQLCRLPLAAIVDVRVIDPRAAARRGGDWRDVHQLKPRDVTLLAFLDSPTLLIELKPGAAGAWWTRNGVPKRLRRHVAVYVDEPGAMRAAIAAALACGTPAVNLGNAD